MMKKYLYLFTFAFLSCKDPYFLPAGTDHFPRPVFPWWDNHYCLKSSKSGQKYWEVLKVTVPGTMEPFENCRPEEVMYFLHLSVPNIEDASCVSLAEEALKKRDFLKEFAFPQDPLTAKEKHLERMGSGKEDYYYRRKYCALQKLEKMGEFDIENSGVIGCCPFTFDGYSCGEGWFSRRNICACALHIKTKSNLKEFYEKLEKHKCEPKE